MTKSTEVPPETGAEEMIFSHRTRYGLYLAPSDELSELITIFYTPSALDRLRGRPIMLGVAQKPVDVERDGSKDSAVMEAEISAYSRLIKKYELGMQFRLKRDGFAYAQERSSRGAATRLLFEIAISQINRDQIMRPPFFEHNTQAPFQASIILRNSDVTPNADAQAQEVDNALKVEHPSAINGMAHYAYYLANLHVAERGTIAPVHLKLVESDKNRTTP